jgi:hypothetical protein
VRRGIASADAVTLFHGEGVHGFIDKSRTPDELVRSWRWACSASATQVRDAGNAVLVMAPSTTRSSRTLAGTAASGRALPGAEVARLATWWRRRGRGPLPKMADQMVDKFQPDGVLIVRAGGGRAIPAIIGGWPGQRVRESRP